MIDIHCHILSGLDDGASDLKESVEMAKIAYKDGVRHIIATPHHCHSFRSKPEEQLARLQELKRELRRKKIDLVVTPGNEVRLEDADFVYEGADGGYLHLDSGKRFVLLEQKWSGYQQRSEEICRWFLSRGTTPILAHPERHGFFREDPGLLVRLLDLGVWAQVTVDSLLGLNGEEAKKFGMMLVRTGRAHVLATDAHNVRRKPNLSQGMRIVKKLGGEDAVRAMLNRMEIIRRSAVQE